MCNCNKSGAYSKPRPAGSAAPVVTNPVQPQRRNPATSWQQVPGQLLHSIPGETVEDRCFAFGHLLGLQEPVPEQVLLAALDTPSYAAQLISSRGKPELQELLKNPPALPPAPYFTNTELVTRAGKALMRWGLSGFSLVPRQSLRRREDACLSCPNLSEPVNALQSMSASSAPGVEIGKRTGNKICGLCGCVVKNKMRLGSETCPDPMPGKAGVNRWGEKI